MHLDKCKKGHFYDVDAHVFCPYCIAMESGGKNMYLNKCKKGHFYDVDAYDSCPYCKKETEKRIYYRLDDGTIIIRDFGNFFLLSGQAWQYAAG